MAVRAATEFGTMEPWLADIIEAERQDATSLQDSLAIGDLWLDNVLVSQAPEHGGLRLYVIDWERAISLEQAIIPKVGVRFSIEVSNKCEARKCPNLGASVPFICSTSIINLVWRFVGPNLA
ncbi:hypothetical protein FRC12_015139 [Ceratobasidium sp. 428]|nr:hypothetical protein FRC12_015139 [Ceratobasidium sp. 428]